MVGDGVGQAGSAEGGSGELGGADDVGLMFGQRADAGDAQEVEQFVEQALLVRGDVGGDGLITNHGGKLHSTMLEMLSRRTLLQILAAGPLAAAGRDLRADVAEIGASTGGVAAALAGDADPAVADAAAWAVARLGGAAA